MAAKPQSRRHSTCHRHPKTPVTGFCACCLRERLVGIEASVAAASGAGSELRRSKSCSGGPRSDDVAADSQRRKSCDVRVRGGNTSLCALFSLDDEKKGAPRKFEAELGHVGFELKEDDEIRVNAEDAARNGGEEDEEDEAELKTMKEFIDLEWTKKKSGSGRDLKDIAGTFWEAASGLSKKLAKWRRKPKKKKLPGENGDSVTGNNDGARARETQSEVGEYGFGGERRSCDTDSRFSVDIAARMSLDECRRFSFDEPRASWDGYLIGRPARMAPMVSVVEDNAELTGPGDSMQTKDYYTDTLSRRRRSFECPKPGEVDDLKLISNAKVSPATTELFYGAKLLITDSELREAKLKAVKDEGAAAGSPSAVARSGFKKPSASQGWHRVWGVLGAKADRKCSGDDGLIKGGSASHCQKLIRSYSVSCQNQSQTASVGENRAGAGALKSREEFLLQRSRNARCSPSNSAVGAVDNGLLRFYLTPLRSYRRSQPGKSRLKTAMMAKNVL